MPRVSKEANRVYQHRWYEQNRELQIERNRKRKDAIRRWFADLKSKQACTTCGESRSVTLDFHHKEGDKEMAVSQGVASGWSKEHIVREINKCVVLCANCHRVEHGLVAQW